MNRRTGAAIRIAMAALIVVASGMAPMSSAAADESVPLTYEGTTYSPDFPESPTLAENQSKVWFHADAWWALLVEPSGRTVRVFELMPDHTWRPTSAVIGTDVGHVGDALRDGDAVHVLTRSSDDSLYYVRLSFDAATRDYRADPAHLVTTRRSRVPATIAKDAAGALWAGYATASSVVVTHSEDGGVTWGRVITVAREGSGQTPELSALIAFDDRVGMLWSDQATGSVRFASHRAGDDPTLWSHEIAAPGPGEADDHISLRVVPGEPSDTLVAAVKTSRGDADDSAAEPLIQLLVRAPGGQWSTIPVSTVADGLNDPVVLVDVATQRLHIFATYIDTVVTKSAPLDALVFPPGIGDIFVSGTGQRLGNPTVTKDVVDARSGLVVLATDDGNRLYRHAEQSLGDPPPVSDPTDHTAPTAPAILRGDAVSPESVVLSWPPATDGNRWVPGSVGVPVASYVIWRDGVEIATVNSTAFEDRARSAAEATRDGSVEYTVVAVDASGNRSAPRTVTVELPGSARSPVPGIVATALIVLAGLVLVWSLVRRHRAISWTRIPVPPAQVTQAPSPTERRTRTPAS